MKSTALLVLLSLPLCTFATSIQPKDPLASEIMIPLFSTGKFISVEDYLELTPKKYKVITGKKIKLKERISLSFGKKLFKKAINKDCTVNMEKMKRGGFWGGFQWHWGGFALGFFLNLVGVIITLFINDDYKWDRFWTALHTSIYVWLILSALVLAFNSNIY